MTWASLTMLANSSAKTLDITAMYFDLLGTEDRKMYTPHQMKAFGAERGIAVFKAIEAAAIRGVSIRLLLGTLNDPMNATEVRRLLAYPTVHARTWDPTLWYGGGIMHAKLWISDSEEAYLGSANTDWKSLAQVKELGVLTTGCAELAADIGRLFDVFWLWADLNPGGRVTQAWSEKFLAELTLPSWDPVVPAVDRELSPFATQLPPLSTPYSLQHQLQLRLSDQPDAVAFVSAAPDGVLLPVRTRDEEALLYTIRGASSTLSLSVMDFLPASAYEGGHGGGPVYWDTLVSAILAVAYARPVAVRLLVSHWAHTSASQEGAMTRLADGLVGCHSTYQPCRGSLEVRRFFVPGWNASTDVFPPYTRVNHAKYIVSDTRVNIGTSNWQWGYFHNTAGASINTDTKALVQTAQAVFDADWNSDYAVPVALPSHGVVEGKKR